jgi:hypothetical protein
MIPTLSLGPLLDEPSIEFMPEDIYPMVALMLDGHSALRPVDVVNILTFLRLDTLYLNDEAKAFFRDLEAISRGIVADELTHYDVAKIRTSEFADDLRIYANDGVISPGVKAAARRFLDFLAANPNHWQRDEPGD